MMSTFIHWVSGLSGAVLLAAVFTDVVSTVMLSTVRSGVLTRLAAGGLWRVWKRVGTSLLGVRLPGFVGLAATFSVVGAWIGLLLAGWFLIFSAIPRDVVSASSGSPADVSARLYFAAYSC